MKKMDAEPETESAGSAFKSFEWKQFGFKSDKTKIMCLHCKAVLWEYYLTTKVHICLLNIPYQTRGPKGPEPLT